MTPGGFPVSPQKGSSINATVVAPAGDPDSSSSSRDSDDLSDQEGGAGGVEDASAPVPEALPRLSIKVPSPKQFTGEVADLKPEAFD